MEDILTQWRSEQLSIASKVIVHPDPPISPEEVDTEEYRFLPQRSCDLLLGGVDVSFPPKEEGEDAEAIAVFALLKSNEAIHQKRASSPSQPKNTFKVVHQNHLLFKLDLPYVPSYLAMRELQPLIKLIQMTENGTSSTPLPPSGRNSPLIQSGTQAAHKADVILVDGNGIMHERLAGIATCLGVNLSRKTIGVSKSLYCVDGLTKEMVKTGVKNKINGFLMWCRDERNAKISEQEASSGNRCKDNCVVICQNAIDVNESLKEKNTSNREINLPLSDLMKELSRYCSAFAVPLRGKSGRVWGAALLGHGGNMCTKGVGTKIPIYISVGHDISLHESVLICAGVSSARIPEPVRQADLLGREWMRTTYSK